MSNDEQSLNLLAATHYTELLAIAHRERNKLRDAATMDTRAVLHEAFLRLVAQRQATWEDRSLFLAAAASTMRRVLVDHVRRRHADKRDHGRQPITLDEEIACVSIRDASLTALDDALVELGGMTELETAHALGITERTVRRDWIKARGWLQCALTEDTDDR
jgi:RNA polymerase sigma factor (TIGR02999 family)